MNISDEEKIKLMLESILTNVELIERNTRELDAKSLEDRLKSLTLNAELSSPTPSRWESLERKLTDIQNSLKSNLVGTAPIKYKDQHRWYIPVFKEWVGSIKRARVVFILCLLLLVLLTTLGFNYTYYYQYRESHYKYQYLFVASDDLESLKRYDEEWKVDSIRTNRLKSMSEVR